MTSLEHARKTFFLEVNQLYIFALYSLDTLWCRHDPKVNMLLHYIIFITALFICYRYMYYLCQHFECSLIYHQSKVHQKWKRNMIFFSNIRIFVLLPIKLIREQCFLKEHDYDFGQILFSLITMLLEFESQSLSYKNDTGLTIFCHVHKVRALFLLPRFNIAVKKTLSSWFVYSPIHLKHR